MAARYVTAWEPTPPVAPVTSTSPSMISPRSCRARTLCIAVKPAVPMTMASWVEIDSGKTDRYLAGE